MNVLLENWVIFVRIILKKVMLISQKHVFLKCKAFRACAICVNILRHKRILYGTAHLYTYTVMKKYNTLKVKIVKKFNGPYKLYG